MFTKKKEKANGGWSETTQQEMIWRTAEVLTPALACCNAIETLNYLAQPLIEGPHGFRLQALMADVRKGLEQVNLPDCLLCGSMLFYLHWPILQAVRNDQFCVHCIPRDAVLAGQLILHQRQTWSTAKLLAADICVAGEADKICQHLQILYYLIYERPHDHPVGGFEELLQLPICEPNQIDRFALR